MRTASDWVLATGGLWLYAALLAAGLLVVHGIGQALGQWRARHADARDQAGIGTITAGMMGLLAFTLGLTISIAEDRFEARRRLVVEEANAIGTAWLRAQLVGGAEGSAMQRLLEDYTRVRIHYTTQDATAREGEALRRTQEIGTALWQQATQLARREPTAVTATLVTALNQVFDMASAQRFAFESRVPSAIQWLLLGGSLLSIGALGYQFGVAHRRHLLLTALLVAMWAGGMVLIIDLHRPRDGHIRPDPAPLVWALQGFEAGR